MHTAVIALAVLTGSCAVAGLGDGSHAGAAAAIAPSLQTGSLIFSAGDCLAVKVFTASRYTHVAAVVVDAAGDVWVYDATSGVGVRRLGLAEYLATQAPVEIHLHHPCRAFSATQARQFEEYLVAQLGRPYDIQHHLTGEPCEGLHCAEYATQALMTIDVLRANQPARVSPASLREGITAYHVYTPGETVQLARPDPPPPADANACERLWIRTKSCCSHCCRKLSGWFLCK